MTEAVESINAWYRRQLQIMYTFPRTEERDKIELSLSNAYKDKHNELIEERKRQAAKAKREELRNA